MRRSLRSGSAPPAVLKEQLQLLKTHITIQEGESESSSTSSPELKAKDTKRAERKKGKRNKGTSLSLKIPSHKGSSEATLRGCAPRSAENLVSRGSESPVIQQARSPRGTRLVVPDQGGSTPTGKKTAAGMTQDETMNGNFLTPVQNNSPQKSPSFRRRKTTTVAKVPSECNIVILGDLGVGKTAFAVRFVTRRYLHEYDPSLERTYERSMEIDGESMTVKLWDTVDKDWEMFTDSADAFILMYDITSVESFRSSTFTANAIKNSLTHQVRTIPVTLLGNKKELEQGRKVFRSEAEDFCCTTGCSFMELSVAQNMDNDIDFLVRSLVKQVQFNKGANEEQSKSSGRRPSTAMHSIKSFLSKMK